MTAMPPKLTPAEPVPPRVGVPFRFTREQYYEMGRLGFFDRVRVERLKGEIIVVSPMNWPHSLAVGNVDDVLRDVFPSGAWINRGSTLPTDDSDPEPDLAVIPGRRRDYTDHPTTALLVVEVSHSTLDNDLTVKAEIYATTGVLDYWVLDLNGRRLFVFRDPAPLPAALGGVAYRTRTEHGEADSVTPLAAPAAIIRVADMLP